LFPAYANDIWRNCEPTNKLPVNDQIIYGKIMNGNDIDMFQIAIDRLGQWTVEYAMEINPGKSKAINFTRILVKNSHRCLSQK
jgi:hypothetical protein